MSDHKRDLANATASLMDIAALAQSYQAAVMRGQVEEAEKIRVKAHDVMDAYLDAHGSAAQAVLSILNR